MRVISGSARGRMLKSLEGELTRPTTDKVKESIFNIIQFDLDGASVLDLFSGSGQLAIEAISRGAKCAVAVDNSRKATEIIKANISACGFEEQIRIYRGDYTEVLTKGQKYDVIFLDPPYKSGLLQNALNIIEKNDILAGNGIIVCESDASEYVGFDPEYEFERREYRYGRISLTVIRRA